MTNEEPLRPNGIPIGTIAPNFKINSISGKLIILNKLLEKHCGVLLDFFRGNWWKHWKTHLILLTSHIKEFEEKKIKVLSIANDSIRLLTKFKEENNFKVDIIADRGAKIAKMYNVYWFGPGGSGNMKIKQAFPSKFLINKQGKIAWTYIGKDKTDRPSIELMMEEIDKIL